MEVKRIRTPRLEVFKTFMEEIFHRNKWLVDRPSNKQINVHKTAKYGDKCLRTLGPHIWN